MILQPRLRFWRPPIYNLTKTANANDPIIGQTGLNFELDRTQPIEEIIVKVKCHVGSSAALVLNGVDNVLGLLKRVRVLRPSGSQAPAGTVVVDYRGIGLLELASNEGLNHSDETLGAMTLSRGANIPLNTQFEISYRIPLVHPGIAEPLRSLMVLPCHTWLESPVISLDFEQAANMYTSGTIDQVWVEVHLVRRQKNDAQTAAILARASDPKWNIGYIPSDLIETNFTVPVGTSGEQRIPIPLGGKLLNQQFCLYQGGASVTRNVPDVITTFGQESIIQLQVGGDTKDYFTWDALKTLNAFSRPRNSYLEATSPAAGLPVVALTAYAVPASVMRDFLSDGIGSGNNSPYELGSVLDMDAVKAVGNKAEWVFTPSNPATNGHTIYYGGRRIWGDISAFQSLD